MHSEQLSQNKNCHEWEALSLSEVNTIKSLIKNRIEFDKFYEVKRYETNSILISNGMPQFYEIIEVTYLDLERLIKNAKLTLQQRQLINQLMDGYDLQYIAEQSECGLITLDGVLNTACQKIKEQNDFEWYEWIETSGKVKVEGTYKQCSKCRKWLKMSEDNFRSHPNTKDQLQSRCRKCERE